MDTLEGKVAVITGAASGIGRAIAHSLARRGTQIVAVDINAGGVAPVVAELRELGVNAAPRTTDIGEPIALDGIRDTALERFGKVDIVVNNVGVLTNGLPQDIPAIEWERILNINLMSVVRSNATFVPMLLDQGSGHIVNTASVRGLVHLLLRPNALRGQQSRHRSDQRRTRSLSAPQEHWSHTALPRTRTDQHRIEHADIRRRCSPAHTGRAVRIIRRRT